MGTVGVIVGRFQVDSPHAGHRALLEKVRALHGKVLICLGCAPVRLAQEDPLDYPTRERMMRSAFPWATIVPLYDQPTNEYWSTCLDAIIGQTFPTDTAVLYGSRKSFLPLYHGRWQTKEIDEIDVASGTELRLKIASEVRDSKDFRAGVIYACSNRYPIVYPTVDVAIFHNNRLAGKVAETEVLLCRKIGYPKPCFPGGFVSPNDTDMASAARREIAEETGLEIDLPVYIGTYKIPDWRYHERNDAIMTTFFAARYIFGIAKGNDDVCGTEWISLPVLSKVISEHHKKLAESFTRYVGRIKNNNMGDKS